MSQLTIRHMGRGGGQCARFLLLRSKFESCYIIVDEKNENEQKEAEVGPFKKQFVTLSVK